MSVSYINSTNQSSVLGILPYGLVAFFFQVSSRCRPMVTVSLFINIEVFAKSYTHDINVPHDKTTRTLGAAFSETCCFDLSILFQFKCMQPGSHRSLYILVFLHFADVWLAISFFEKGNFKHI